MPTIPKSETAKQVNSLKKSKDKIFTFLLDENILPDNNTSERAIRNMHQRYCPLIFFSYFILFRIRILKMLFGFYKVV